MPVSSRSPLSFTKTRSLRDRRIKSKGSWIVDVVSMKVQAPKNNYVSNIIFELRRTTSVILLMDKLSFALSSTSVPDLGPYDASESSYSILLCFY